MSMKVSPTVLSVLAQGLNNIAAGAWNAGRKPEDWMTASQYAALILRDAGLDPRPGDDG